ncbi:complex I subunit 5 family protein [Halobacterium wangiae]|uniref:complex I subunit 5 family protein n=1 Tax=Halobacterium wangiae TaxID=2902623 RepID=UPI001E28C9D8|nr:proton-conducting transporter membrane subunit [Halobacterium wangiae]
MTEQLVVAPVLVALATAVLCLVARRSLRVQRALSVLGVFAYSGVVAALAARVLGGGIVAYNLGSWPAPAAIVFVADALSVFMLSLAAVLAVPALLFSVLFMDELGEKLTFHPLFHFMLAGVTGAFLTGDIFNLFVWFEVMLMASYVLVVFYGGSEHTRAGLNYLVLNLVASAIMLLAIGGIYATTGTLNMADIAMRVASPAEYGVSLAPVLGLSMLLFTVFAVKAGVVPFQWWVPAAYDAAPAPVAAMLAGVVKKVGMYALVRLYFTVFAAAQFDALAGLPWGDGSALAYFAPVVLVMAALSIFFGGLSAIGADHVEELLAYSSIGQVGFIVLPLSVAAFAPADATAVRRLGIVAALVYALNHTLSKGLLFLVAGTIKDAFGTTRFHDLDGIARNQPVVAGAFLIGGLGLVGLPPLTGFFGKLLVFQSAVVAESWLALAVALGGALFTIAYVSRAWNRGFWGVPSPAVEGATADRRQVALLVAVASAVVLLGVGFQPVYEFAGHAADAALDRTQYVDTVLPDGGALETEGGGH